MTTDENRDKNRLPETPIAPPERIAPANDPYVSGLLDNGHPNPHCIAGLSRMFHDCLRIVVRRDCEAIVHATRAGEKRFDQPADVGALDALTWRSHVWNLVLEMHGQMVIGDWETVVADDNYRADMMQRALDCWAACVGAAHAAMRLGEWATTTKQQFPRHRPRQFELAKAGMGARSL